MEFTDLYINDKNPDKSLVFPGPKVLPAELRDLVSELAKQARAIDKQDFAVSSGDVHFRGHTMHTVSGVYYALRKMPSELWSLSRCGVSKELRSYIASPRHNNGGLFVVSGMPGNGKSTTCAAIIQDRLKRYGGMCATVEDPVEMPLHGIHGKGLCLQSDIGPAGSFAESVRATMRAYPTGCNTIMLIGEVRDPDTAALALRSSVDGRLVLISVHAGDVVQTLHRCIILASERLGVAEARNLLASSLRLVMHQRLIGRAPDVELQTSTLFDTQDVVGVIRNPQTPLESINTQIATQEQRLKTGQPIAVRKI